MATNPMQKKSRTSFILGMLLMLVIMGIIVALLLYQLINLKQAENEREASLVKVSVLKSDVKSGETVSTDMFSQITVESTCVPSNAINSSILEENTIAKIDLSKGTILTEAMITTEEEKIDNTLRVQEYNMLKLASQIETGDYIDIRLRMPSGLDYIVVSKKKVEIPTIDGVDSLNTIWVKLTEDETLAMSNAIVEAYEMEGAILYTTKYVEPGMQTSVSPTYVPSAEVVNLITQNPDIAQEARQAIYNRYNTYTSIRNSINGEISQVEADDRTDNINSNVETEIETAQEQRQAYLDALAGY